MDVRPLSFRRIGVHSYGKYQSPLHAGHLRQQQQVVGRVSCRVRRLQPVISFSMSTDVMPASKRHDAGVAQRATQVPSGTRVVVVGGSIAGMLAAAAVAPFIDEVLVLDKENTLNGGGNEDQLRKVRMAYCPAKLAYP